MDMVSTRQTDTLDIGDTIFDELELYPDMAAVADALERELDMQVPATALAQNYGLRQGKTRMRTRARLDPDRDDYGPVRFNRRCIHPYRRRNAYGPSSRGCRHCMVRNRIENLLERSVGRPWNRVFSQICHLARSTGRQKHRLGISTSARQLVMNELDALVYRQCYRLSGVLYGHHGCRPAPVADGFYVDPATGRLAKFAA